MGQTTGTTIHKIKIDQPCYRMMQPTITAEDEGQARFAFSSTKAAQQYYGREILSHEDGAIDFERMNTGAAPLLWNHNRDKVLGINLRGWLEEGRGHAQVKFDLEDEFSKSIYDRMGRGVLRNVSVFYDIGDYEERYDEDLKTPYIYVRQWTPLETSIVSVPADPSVGIGRSADQIIWTPNYSQDDKSQETIEKEEAAGTESGERTAMSPAIITDDDVKAAREAALAEERERQQGIRGLLKDYGDRHPAVKGKIEEALDKNWPVESTRSAIADIILGDAEIRPPIQQPVSQAMDESERKNYSLFRAMKASLESTSAQELKKIAPFEYEVSQRVSEQIGRSTTGIFLPVCDLVVPRGQGSRGQMSLTSGGRASYNVGTAAEGGNLVENALREEMMIEYLFNRPVVSRMGATRLMGLRGDFDFPVEDASSIGIDWVAEDGAAQEKNSTFTLKAMSPRTAAAYMRVTRQMMLQSEIAMEPYLRSRLGIALALGVDSAALNGTGAGNEPRGILNTPGINPIALGTDGGTLDWANVVKMESEIQHLNADVSPMGYVTNSRVRGTLKTTEKATNTGMFIWEPGDTLNGYPAMASSQLRSNLTKGTGTNLSEIIFGAWDQLMIGQWGIVELMTNPYGNDDFIRGSVKTRIMFSLDIQVGHEESFSAITDVITN